MPTARLTKRTVDSAAVMPRRYTLFDDQLKGFGLRVSPSGKKSWVVEYRPSGGGRNVAKKRLTLGTTGSLTPAQARSAAAETLARARLGNDPAAEKVAERNSVTVRYLSRQFIEQHVKVKRKPGTVKNYDDIFTRLVLPALGQKKANAVSRVDITKLHLSLKSTPFQANRMLAVVGAMYSFAEKNGLVPEGANPARKIEKYREHRRERFLTSEELARLGKALREAETTGIPWNVNEDQHNAKHIPKPQNRRTIISSHVAAAIRLLIFTGARLREILNLRWEHIDFGRGLLLLPDSKTGQKAIVLSKPALHILEQVPRDGLYVIAGLSPDKPRADLHRPWRLVSKRAQLDGVRLHDLRHTYASIGAASGLGLPILGKLLGHRESATTQRYAHLSAEPVMIAANRVAGALEAAMSDASEPS